ncbi:Alkaline phosphatase-like alpha/beta/alpha [Penicillium cf. griseofulvum]|uniref:Alkaline phosphatase-like alpha/beta/alpha n=1 Tax=Penicillium cf. griseofulvum TaxID=2972120 RepID=A0A9W9IU79_9EURO|nr:Alkaline phosphatase-like alpha/beta/alpha [Penicillium cf. griseofulvum]KAJ5429955.1 Alkaline phosphatase-like alpha/beta/alpha [Penicillium cf. griseofulvum]
MSIFALLPPLPPFLFSALVVSGLASKALHIALHFQSLPFLYFVLYSPTLILPDVLVIIFVRVLLRFHAPESRWQWLSTGLGGALSLITWGASSIQFGFFLQTGAEVAWAAGGSFLSDPAAMKILLSGISTVSAAATVLGLVAWMLHSHLYNITGLGLQAIRDLCVGGFKARYTLITAPSKSCMASVDLRSFRRIIPAVAICVSLIFLEITRPAIPYDHISGALPLTLLDAFQKKTATVEGCREPARPFPLMITDDNGVSRPQFQPDSTFVEQWSRATWLPENPPRGFSRWELSPSDRAEKDNHYSFVCADDQGFYDPKNDPLMITNLGGEIYEPLEKAFKEHSVEVNHIVLLTLESGRKELFPTQQGTPLFDGLIASHKKEKTNEAIDRLVTMTPVAQQLTGEYATDSKGNKVDLSHSPWQTPPQEGMGGLNVRGAMTGSSLTFKSVLGSHCGVNPLPVDLLEESLLEIYQPCLPQIFDLFNQGKSEQRRGNSSSEGKSAALKNPWKSVFMQSITDDYDRQDVLNENMGFKHKVVKSTLVSPQAKHKAQGEEINYFGYAETELRPYVLDLFEEAANNKTRMFFSHVTSTTHHPWSTPEDFEKEPYMSDQGNINHDLMNNYLNAARFVDNWLGDIMTMLDQTGIANETLVVVVGDHGQAFGEDNKDMTGTYENGHISNFRVPLVFHHPHMPRVDITANATALSIVPTILDLLVQSNSLDERDSEIASSLLPEYQGQSLIRPFLSSMEEPHHRRDSHHHPPPDEQSEHARENTQHEARSHETPARRLVWNIGLINAGGSMLSIMAADVPYRLILPLKDGFEYTFTHLGEDPGETHFTKAWTLEELIEEVEPKYGAESAEWLANAELIGKWWVGEQKRIWGYREA